MKRIPLTAAAIVVAGFVMTLAVSGDSAAQLPSTVCVDVLTFESFGAGVVVSETVGAGGLGPVGIAGDNPRFAAGTNAAIVFDSACPGGCSGADPPDEDLGTPNQAFAGPGVGSGGGVGGLGPNDEALGNVLIVAENLIDADMDGRVDDPDDQKATTVVLRFDFSVVGPVAVRGLTIVDVDEEPGQIELLGAEGASLAIFTLPETGDNGKAVALFGPLDAPVEPLVETMVLTLHGSAAVDDIVFETSCDDGDPCTVDSCDALLGCINEPIDCDDGLFCTGVESCVAGECVRGTPPCEGGAECATTCNEDTQDCFDPAGTECTDDGEICTDDFCDGEGECVHKLNPDNDPSCQPGFFTITFGLEDPVTVGSMDVDVDYSAVVGEFVGEGTNVDCTWMGAFGAGNDLDDQRLLVTIYINQQGGLTGPADFFSCEFEAPVAPDPDAFEIAVEGAADPGLNLIEPPPVVRVTSIVPSAPTVARSFAACPIAALRGCREPDRAAFDLLDREGVSRDRLKWSWRGATTGSGGYGAPAETTDYALCIYDSQSNRALIASELRVDAGSDWRSSRRGFAYKDGSGKQAGVSSIRIRNGARGRTKLVWKAGGTGLPTPVPVFTDQCFAQDPSVVVQVVNAAGACWTSSFTDTSSNTGAGFKARLR